jgi:plasmid stability protein
MAKAKSAGASSPKTKIVRLELDLDQHAKLRVVAAQHGMSMAAFARFIVEKAIKEGSEDPSPKRPAKKGGSS